MNNLKQTIVIFTTDLYRGGIAQATYKYALALKEFYKVTLVVYDNVPINYELPEEITLKQIKIPLAVNWGKTKSQRFFKKTYRVLGLPLAFAKFLYFIYKSNPKIIFSLGYIPNIINICSKVFFVNIHRIISERTFAEIDLEKTKLKGRLLRGICSKVYKRSDLILSLTEELKDSLILNYNIKRDKIIVCPNFFMIKSIKEKGYKTIPDEHSFIKNKNIIINTGRITRQKGQWFLIRVFKELLKSYPDWYLVILGDGELEIELKELVEKLDINSNVFFLGNVENPFMYYKLAKLFVFPSLWEGFPNALVEAMISGLPVISSNCSSGPKEILKLNGYPDEFLIKSFPNKIIKQGELIKPELDLLSAIKKIICDDNLRKMMSEEAYNIGSKYSDKNVIYRLVNILDNKL